MKNGKSDKQRRRIRMVDIHMHVTPFVDDGSRSIKESLEMLRLAGTQGVTAVIATPHGGAFDSGYSELVRSRFFDSLERMLSGWIIGRLFSAKESNIYMRIMTEIILI